MHVMLDLETMGVRPDAMVVQIGAVLFEPVNGGKILNGPDKTFNRYVKIQDGAGSIDHGTVQWWLGQSPAAVKRLHEGMKTAVTLPEALAEFAEWPTKVRDIGWDAIDGIWSHAAFDVPVLASAYAKVGCDHPWHYRAPKDLRTLYWLACGGQAPEIDWTGLVSHDALDDAIGQAMQVQKAMALLGR